MRGDGLNPNSKSLWSFYCCSEVWRPPEDGLLKIQRVSVSRKRCMQEHMYRTQFFKGQYIKAQLEMVMCELASMPMHPLVFIVTRPHSQSQTLLQKPTHFESLIIHWTQHWQPLTPLVSLWPWRGSVEDFGSPTLWCQETGTPGEGPKCSRPGVWKNTDHISTQLQWFYSAAGQSFLSDIVEISFYRLSFLCSNYEKMIEILEKI